MNKNKQIELIRKRYVERRENDKMGWADDKSYERKIKNAQALVTRYKIPEGARFLEIGCGAGNVAVHMAKSGLISYGIDFAPEAIDWARSNAEKEGVDTVFTVGDVASLEPYEDNFFDIVFDGDCLWMVIGEDRPKCLANVFRILKPGGIFFAQAHIMGEGFNQPYEAAPGALVDPVTLTSSVENVPMYQYSREEGFLDEIRDAGFEILSHSISKLGEETGDDRPFYKGVMFVESILRIKM